MEMDFALFIKLIHILSATLLFGTGLGTAFHGLFGYIRGDLTTKMVVGRNVVLADWLFTTPAAIIQFITGVWLAYDSGYPLFEGWVLWAIILYFFVGACWLPVVWLQIEIAKMAKQAALEGAPLPPRCDLYAKIWFFLGWPAFLSMMGIFYLMVVKPDL